MYEFLKKLFGTNEDGTPAALTYDQLVAKLGEDKTIKLANLAEGGYVAKDKFDAKDTELKGLSEQLKTANATIQSYKDMDIEGVKKSVSDWEKRYNDDTAALRKSLEEKERGYATDLFFRGYKFSSKMAESGIRAEFDKLNLPLVDGNLVGGKEFMEQLMADDDNKAAFVIETPAPATPPAPTPEPTPAPAGSGFKPKFADPTPTHNQPKPKMSLAEMMKRKNADPNAEIKFD
ncbi:MAG: phage scaffolding protein [Oscillospiraceae bacterium]|nr:phage scaffolding protein [Oscillospiraceae bacterium]